MICLAEPGPTMSLNIDTIWILILNPNVRYILVEVDSGLFYLRMDLYVSLYTMKVQKV